MTEQIKPDSSEDLPKEKKASWETLIELMENRDVIASIKDILDIDTEGLTLKGENERSQFYDVNEKFKDSHMESGFNAPLANSLYGLNPSVKLDSPEYTEILKALELFKDQIVVDLGAGEHLPGYYIADRAGASAYVAIEPNFTNGLAKVLAVARSRDSLSEQEYKEMEKSVGALTYQLHRLNNTSKVAVVKEDMLTFLRRVPDASVSIECSGIDGLVLPDQKYREDVAKEIVRVLHPKGAYVGGNGNIAISDTENISVEKLGMYGSYKDKAIATVYRKKET